MKRNGTPEVKGVFERPAGSGSGVKGRKGDLAIMQAVMKVNAVQALKADMQEPTRRHSSEGRS